MKYYHCFRLRSQGCPKHIFAEVLKLAPGSLLHYGDIEIEAGVEHASKAELVEKVVAFCAENGLAQSGGGHQPGTYGHEIVRHYEPGDLAKARFLKLNRQKQIQLEHARDEQGRLLMAASKARAGRKIGRIYPNWIVVSETTRKILADGNFVGLEFREVALKGKSTKAATEPFWELRSSLTLPKMANTGQLIMVESVPFNGDYSQIVWINDRPFRTGEIHYRECDLKTTSEFDVALTLEKYMEPHPALVVSQRFYQHCLKHKIPLEVEPVRIDPD